MTRTQGILWVGFMILMMHTLCTTLGWLLGSSPKDWWDCWSNPIMFSRSSGRITSGRWFYLLVLACWSGWLIHSLFKDAKCWLSSH